MATLPTVPPPSTTDASVPGMIPSGPEWTNILAVTYNPLPSDISTVGVDMSDHQMTPYDVAYAISQAVYDLEQRARAAGKRLYAMAVYQTPSAITSSQGRGGNRFILVTER